MTGAVEVTSDVVVTPAVDVTPAVVVKALAGSTCGGTIGIKGKVGVKGCVVPSGIASSAAAACTKGADTQPRAPFAACTCSHSPSSERPIMLMGAAPSISCSTFSPVCGALRRLTPAGALIVAETVITPLVIGAGEVVVVMPSVSVTTAAVPVRGVVPVRRAVSVKAVVAVVVPVTPSPATMLARSVSVTLSLAAMGAAGAGSPAAVRIVAASAYSTNSLTGDTNSAVTKARELSGSTISYHCDPSAAATGPLATRKLALFSSKPKPSLSAEALARAFTPNCEFTVTRST